MVDLGVTPICSTVGIKYCVHIHMQQSSVSITDMSLEAENPPGAHFAAFQRCSSSSNHSNLHSDQIELVISTVLGVN